ncbi:Cytochrome c oxidase subunit 6A [Blattella germanica]|nr:Cytochrome c oxidase subunit 6A [Blattella germanica]
MAGVLGNTIRQRIISSVPVRNVHGPSAGEHSGGSKLWKNISLFVAIPSVGLCMVNAYLKHQEEAAHHETPEFIPYEHLRKRDKRFPWGDGTRSLFHNPHVNPLPDGYEHH